MHHPVPKGVYLFNLVTVAVPRPQICAQCLWVLFCYCPHTKRWLLLMSFRAWNSKRSTTIAATFTERKRDRERERGSDTLIQTLHFTPHSALESALHFSLCLTN